MARIRRRPKYVAGELNLTAMIDVAFQLLAFFILTTHPVDVIANLTVARPMPQPTPGPEKPFMKVVVFPDGYVVNGGATLSPEALSTKLERLASSDRSQLILIECINEANHERLITLLDICAKLGLHELAVVSSGGA